MLSLPPEHFMIFMESSVGTRSLQLNLGGTDMILNRILIVIAICIVGASTDFYSFPALLIMGIIFFAAFRKLRQMILLKKDQSKVQL